MVLSAEQKCLLWLSNAEVTPGHVQKLLSVTFSPAVTKELLEENPLRILRNMPLDPVEPEWFS